VFRSQDTRMRNEELITSLAYMDYKKNISDNPLRSVLDIFIRSGRVSARIKKKADITKILTDITNNDTTRFENSVNNVLHFIEKIKLLTDGDDSYLNIIFAHRSKSNQSRTNQNFYLLWVLLDGIKLEEIACKKSDIVEKLISIYRMIQKVPSGFTIENLFETIDNFNINK
jgi:hypothetical protein